MPHCLAIELNVAGSSAPFDKGTVTGFRPSGNTSLTWLPVYRENAQPLRESARMTSLGS